MLADDFIQQKRADWERLEELLARAQSARLRRLSAADVYELGRLYRQATSDLAVARRDFPQHRVTLFLNNLVARAHAAIYRDDVTTWQRIRRFIVVTYPRTWRAMLPFTLAACALFLAPALIAFAVAVRNPTQAELLFPGAEGLAQAIRQREEWWRTINVWRSGSAAMIAGNNILVTLQAFAGGMLFGLLTIYAMMVNGLMLGVVAGLSAHYGFSERLWGFVAAHATIELSVIWFAGGAGLQLPWAILRPGLLTRGAALRLAAQRAAVILLGCIPLLIIAGLIEAFISPSDLPTWLKYGVSLASGVALYSYLWGAGRDRQERATP